MCNRRDIPYGFNELRRKELRIADTTFGRLESFGFVLFDGLSLVLSVGYPAPSLPVVFVEPGNCLLQVVSFRHEAIPFLHQGRSLLPFSQPI